MYNIQANTARFIYTLSDRRPENSLMWCRLTTNSHYFSKEARSDEKLRYTESDMQSIVRTILFIFVFDANIEESLVDIINSGCANIDVAKFVHINLLNVGIASDLLDHLFGIGFSTVVRKPLAIVLDEYNTQWRYFFCTTVSLALPNATDIINLVRFVNNPSSKYAPATQFIMKNSTDHKILLQNAKKRLS